MGMGDLLEGMHIRPIPHAHVTTIMYHFGVIAKSGLMADGLVALWRYALRLMREFYKNFYKSDNSECAGSIGTTCWMFTRT